MHAQCQSIASSTISWSTTKTFNVTTGETSPESSQLISYQQSKVEWKAESGALKYSFNVTGTSGSWADVSQDGEIIYKVRNADFNGNIYFSKIGTDIRIRIIIQNGADPVVYDLTVYNTQAL